MLDIIQYKDIKKYKVYFPFDNYTNSRLYYDKDLLHKIFFYKQYNLETTLKKLDNLKLEELVEIKKLIYKGENFVGYSIKNYKEYKSLNKFKHRNFDLKKKDCFKLVESLNKLIKNDLSYIDFNSSNVLLNSKTNDIKICDLDSLILINDPADKKLGLKNLLIFVLSYLYNINQRDIRNVINYGSNHYETYVNSCNIKQEDITLKYISKAIENLQQENIRKEKSLIMKQSRDLISTGYSKFL